MADAEAEAAFLSSMQVLNQSAGSYSNAGESSGEQIESSDEYDPAQDVQDVSLPAPTILDVSNRASSIASSNNASRPTSTQPLSSKSNIPAEISTNQPNFPLASISSPTAGPNGSSTTERPTHISQAGNTLPSPSSTVAKVRLPHDKTGILEDRIKEDEKGDIEAWLSLINEHKSRGKLDDTRKVYERFLAVFPQAAEQWVAFTQLESESGNRSVVEAIFSKTLKDLASLQLWSAYLDHIRRYFNIAVDKSGNASQTNHAAYEAVLDAVGIDKDSGRLWYDYIQFIKSSPGIVGGSSWQDQQKMDLLRKAYSRAICIPTQSVEAIWKEYSNFEMSLNKLTGRKFLQERSPDYMSARSSYMELQNITRDLRRTTLPALPPATGFEGDTEYMRQVEIWKKWIQWEKNDPLVLKEENTAAYKNRTIYAYKQALMALRFWPEIWFEAAEFCFDNDLESEGNEFLSQGVTANPESCLLAFKHADRLELSTTNGNDDDSKEQRGKQVREPYNRLLDALYALIAKAMDREVKEIARIEAAEVPTSASAQTNGDIHDDEKDVDDDLQAKETEGKKKLQIDAVKARNAVQMSILNKTISHAWIALMRAMQRMQGKGKPGAQIGGSRQIFTDARKRGRITSDVWIAAAMLEFHNTDSESAKRIFERGMKLFPEDESYALEYIKVLTNTNDHTNARVVFETTVGRLSQKSDTLPKTKPLYVFFHQYESHYGELAQVMKLEKRMKDAFPTDPKLSAYSQRFVHEGFDPTAVRLLISPGTQARPKSALPSIEEPIPTPVSPPNRQIQVINSPKRPLLLDDFDSAANPSKRQARGESPLAGAAGRRVDQLKRNRQPYDSTQSAVQGGGFVPPPPPLPRDVLFLLSIIPGASAYHDMMMIPPEAVVRLVRDTHIPNAANQLPPRPFSQMPPAHLAGQMPFAR